MNENAIILSLGAVITTLAGVIVWLFKSHRKEIVEKIEECKKAHIENTNALNKNTMIMEKVEQLLSSYRGFK